MATLRYTTDELVEALKRTRIRTIVVEGGDDLEILRDLEARLSQTCCSVDFCVAGDKKTVLEIWRQKAALPGNTIGFLADSDLWLFNNQCLSYPSVVFTNGYSIENICIRAQSLHDFAGARAATNERWQRALGSLVDWFSGEVAYYLNGENPLLDIGIQQILDIDTSCDLTPQARTRIASAPQALYVEAKEKVRIDPFLYIRGKQLFLTLSEVLKPVILS